VSQALAGMPALGPDVVLLNVRLPDGNGVELCRELKSKIPSLNCLMLGSCVVLVGGPSTGCARHTLLRIDSGSSRNTQSEVTNTHLRALTRWAYGLHSAEALIAMAMLTRGGLCPPLPGR
jgi:hypothetical protein